MEFSLLIPLFENGYRPALESRLMPGWLSQIPLVILMLQRHVSATWRKWSIALWGGLLSRLPGTGRCRDPGGLWAPALPYIIPISSLRASFRLGISGSILRSSLAVWIAAFLAAAFYIQAFNTAVAEVLQLSGKVSKDIICGVTLLCCSSGRSFPRTSAF